MNKKRKDENGEEAPQQGKNGDQKEKIVPIPVAVATCSSGE